MDAEQIREIVREQPFVPFFIIMSKGEKLHVPHEDFIWIMPNGRVVMVALPSGASRWVNINLIAGLEKPAPPKKSTRITLSPPFSPEARRSRTLSFPG